MREDWRSWKLTKQVQLIAMKKRWVKGADLKKTEIDKLGQLNDNIDSTNVLKGVKMSKLLYDVTKWDEEMTPELLGGKGFGLAVMTKIGVNVPPAFVISTDACDEYQKNPKMFMQLVAKEILPEIKAGLTKHFGYMPLVSVRSGARVSMPGMMDTILNVGLCLPVDKEWQERIGFECWENSASRLAKMYRSVVGVEQPETVDAQLLGAIEAVFKSWNNERAKSYRKMNKIPDDWGTAVVVQAMVFGNSGEKSCTGVLFSRNPSTGENQIVGEFLRNAQGEDVVDGSTTPEQLNQIAHFNPDTAKELAETVEKLEAHFRDMQDVEFTVQDGKLFILQTRSGKRTAMAAIKIAVDMKVAGLITAKEAVDRVSLKQFLSATRPMIDEKQVPQPTCKGIAASNGTATGVAVLSSKDAVNCKEPCILVTDETTPDDIEGMNAAVGILTRKGGATSHAAVVARGMDKVCVVGCLQLPSIMPGVKVTIDGATGRVWIGSKVPITDGSKMPEVEMFKSFMVEAYPYLRVVTKLAEVSEVGTFFGSYELDGLEDHLITEAMKSVALRMKSGVIDITPHREVLDVSDFAVATMFGNSIDETKVMVAKMKGLTDAGAKGKDVWVVGKMSSSLKMALKGQGFKLMPVIDNVDSLVLAEAGLAVVDSKKLSQSMSSEALAKMMKMKAAVGESFEMLDVTTVVQKESFSNGRRIAMSDMCAMQSLLA